MNLQNRRARATACAASPTGRTLLTWIAILIAVVTVTSLTSAMAGRSMSSWTIEDRIIVTSFDGTEISATMMLPEGASASNRVPVAMNSHGFGPSSHRARTPAGTLTRLLNDGYAVLTWDARGFGESEGESHLDSTTYEVKDVQALITYLGNRPEIIKDGPGDPRVGLFGVSYAAMIQLNTAAFDSRIEAIIPKFGGGNEVQDITPNDVLKERWKLDWSGTTRMTAEFEEMQDELRTTGLMSSPTKDWLRERSVDRYSARVRTPTLLMQGTIDTLFPPQDGFTHYLNIIPSGTPLKMLAICDGHDVCPYPGGPSGYPSGSEGRPDIWQERLLAWMDKHVKGLDVGTGANFEWQTQYGYYRPAPQYPLPGRTWTAGRTVEADLAGPEAIEGDSPSGGLPATAAELSSGAAVRARVYGPAAGSMAMVGVPSVHLVGSVQGPGETIIFLELVEVTSDGARRTVDQQVIPVRLPPGPIDKIANLNGVAWLLRPGYSLELEITTGSVLYRNYSTQPFSVQLDATPSLPLAPIS